MTGLQSFAFCLIWLDEIAASFVAQSDCWLERVEKKCINICLFFVVCRGEEKNKIVGKCGGKNELMFLVPFGVCR